MNGVPATVLTGFLGAGKTTLLNHVLRADSGRRWAVIVNEFGEAGIDGDLIGSGGEELVELSNGCLCCTVRGDLLRTLYGLLPRIEGFDGVLIETTGLADPGPVAQTFLIDATLRAAYQLDGIVTVVDALHILDQLGTQAEAAEQIAFADLAVLTKTDLVRPQALPAIRARLHAINPGLEIVTADRGEIDPAVLFGRGAFDLDRVETLLAAAEARGPLHHHHHGDADSDHDHDPACCHDHDHDHDHDGYDHGPASVGITSVSLRADQPLDEEKVIGWLSDHLATHGQDVLRLKGILDTGDDRRLVLQGVHMILEGDHGSFWPSGRRESRLVMIGRGLDAGALRQAFTDCVRGR